MRSLILAGGLATVLALPGLASAQTRCERDQQTNRVAGTVVGAGIGALLGSAVAGRGDGTAGAVIGGVAGAVAGNQLAKGAGQPCPAGYYEVPATAPAPVVAAPPPSAFWSRGPAGVRERIDYLEARIHNGERDGVLTRAEADQAYRDLGRLRREEMRLRRRDGGRLNGADRDYLQARLDDVGRQVRWAERNDAYAATPSYASPSYSTPSYSTPSYSTPSYSTPSYATPSYAPPTGYNTSTTPEARGYYDSQGYWHAQ